MLSRFSHVPLFTNPWATANQTPLSIGFPRQEHWSGLPFSPLRDLPDPGIELASPALAGGFFTTRTSNKGHPEYNQHDDSCHGFIAIIFVPCPTPLDNFEDTEFDH